MELNERLDKELERRFEDLENLKTGSDEQGKATDNIVKLYKLRMDENEQENSKNADEDKAVLERHKLELEEQKAKDDIVGGVLMSVSLFFGGLAFTMMTAKEGDSNENLDS